MSHASLALLRDHMVLGSALMPAAAFMEVAHAASRILLDGMAAASTLASGLSARPLLTQISIPAAFPLSTGSSKSSQVFPSGAFGSNQTSHMMTIRAQLLCEVDLSAGKVQLSSSQMQGALGTPLPTTHLQGAIQTSPAGTPFAGSSFAVGGHPLQTMASAGHLPWQLLIAQLPEVTPADALANVAGTLLSPQPSEDPNPAKIDAAFHLGAIFPADLSHSMTHPPRATLRIPVAARVYSAGGQFSSHTSHASQWAAGKMGLRGDMSRLPTADGPAVGAFSLQDGAAGTAVGVHGLQVQPISRRAAVVQQAAANGAISHASGLPAGPRGFLYATHWLADASDQAPLGKLAPDGPMGEARVKLPARVHLARASGYPSTAASLLRAIAKAQQLISGKSAGLRFSAMSLPSATPHFPSSNGASVNRSASGMGDLGMWALAKTIATETGNMEVTFSSENALAPGPSHAATQPEIGGESQLGGALHAASTTAGFGFRAHLVPSQSPAKELSSALPAGCNCLTGHVAITGGLGALGQLTATWLLQASSGLLQDWNGSSHSAPAGILLMGRSAKLSPTSLAAISAAKQSSAMLAVQMCDASMWADTHSALANQVGTRLDSGVGTHSGSSVMQQHPLAAVLHAGGSLADATLQRQTAAGIRKVAGGKPHAAMVLCDITHSHPLSSIAMFSSVASLLGSAGQANYAAANGILDEMAVGMQNQGRVGAAIQWGPWGGAGMAKSLEARMQRQGLGMVNPLQGLQVLRQLLSGLASPILAAAPLDLIKLHHTSADAAAFVAYSADLTTTSAAAASSSFVHPASLIGMQAQRSAAAGLVEGQRLLGQALQGHESHAVVMRIVRDVLGQAPSPEEPLMAAGLDSLGAIELKNGLEAAFGVTLPSTLAFDYPTATALATYISSLITPPSEQATTADSNAPRSDPHALAHIPHGLDLLMDGPAHRADAVVGVESMTHSHPGGVEVKIDKVGDASGLVPLARWDVESQPPIGGAPALRFSAFLQDIDMFDAALFSTSDKEAVLMDPQQRLLLEASAKVLFEAPAGCRAVQLRKTAGVFVGISSTEYGEHQWIACMLL